VVLAAEQVLDGAARLELKAADLADDFTGEHEAALAVSGEDARPLGLHYSIR
jgi:hypothetical protein